MLAGNTASMLNLYSLIFQIFNERKVSVLAQNHPIINFKMTVAFFKQIRPEIKSTKSSLVG